jgi:hypothetical protein
MSRSVDPLAQIAQHTPHFMRVRASGQDTVLRPLQFGRRDHLHGFRDLLRIFKRRDLAAQ